MKDFRLPNLSDEEFEQLTSFQKELYIFLQSRRQSVETKGVVYESKNK